MPARTTGEDARTARLHCQGDLGLTEMLRLAYRVRKFAGELGLYRLGVNLRGGSMESKIMRFVVMVWVLGLCLFISLPSRAQVAGGIFSGTSTDPAGSVVPNP